MVPYRDGFEKAVRRDAEQCDRLWRFFYDAIPQDERGWLEIVGWIPMDDILIVDDLGDAFNGPPHILVTRDHRHGFFAHTRTFLQSDRDPDGDYLDPGDLKRTSLFPDPIPDVESKQRW